LKKLLLTVLFLFVITFSFSQKNPYFIRYSIEEGLPTSNIYSAFEDFDGYIWFATDVGVLRFDGYDFKHFNTDDGLADNEIFKIFQDKQKRIWFLSLNGKLSYYLNNHFFNTKTTSFLNTISYQTMVMDVSEGANGSLYFLFRDGHVSILDKSENVTQVNNNNGSSYSIWQSESKPHILTRTSIINIETNDVIKLPDDIVTSSIYRYTINENNDYFFSTKNVIYKFKENQFEPVFNASEKEIVHLNIINKALWIGTRNGLIIKTNNQEKTFFNNDLVSSALKDSQGSYWITTLNNGIKFIPEMELVKHDLSSNNLKINALQTNLENSLFIGTQTGLYKKLKDSDKYSLPIAYPKINNPIKKLRSFDKNIFSIGTESIQIFENQEIRNYSFGANDVLYDDSNYYLSSTIVFKIQKNDLLGYENSKVKDFSKTFSDDIIFKRRTNVITKGVNNQVFLGTSTGLFMLNNGKVIMVNSLNEELNTSILDMFYDFDTNQLLVATNSKGLIILENNEVVNHITKLQKLNSNVCNTIKKLDDNTYLIGTNKGLNLVKIKTGNIEVENYSNLLKIADEKINDIELVDDDIYLATDKSLLSFNLKTIKVKKHIPKILINGVLINGESIDDTEDLKHYENNVIVSYTGISYSDYGELTYEYKLNNEPNWTSTANRQIEFKNLPHDKYNLQIRTIGNNKAYSKNEIVNFTIKPPFWKTIPFIVGVFTLSGLLIYLFIKSRLKRQNRQFELERITYQAKQEKIELEKQTAELEQKALRLQMNPHFIFNALNTIKGYYSGGNIEEANKYITRFSKLLRLVLENDEHIVSLEKEVEMLQLYIKLIQLRYQNIFDFRINISKEIDIDTIGVPPLLLQPIVENAIIHGIAPNTLKGQLDINFSMKSNKLFCTVTDNGVGFKVSQANKIGKHKSKAIQITKERVQLINNSSNSDNFKIIKLYNPVGTQIIVKLPIIKLW